MELIRHMRQLIGVELAALVNIEFVEPLVALRLELLGRELSAQLCGHEQLVLAQTFRVVAEGLEHTHDRFRVLPPCFELVANRVVFLEGGGRRGWGGGGVVFLEGGGRRGWGGGGMHVRRRER